LFFFAALTGCQKDLLDSTPYGQITTSQFWRNSGDVVAATNAVYSPLLDEDGFAHTEYTFDNSSDDMVRAGDHGESEAQLELFTFNASNSHILNTWSTKYEVIARANAVLINAPHVTMDQTLKNQCLGRPISFAGLLTGGSLLPGVKYLSFWKPTCWPTTSIKQNQR